MDAYSVLLAVSLLLAGAALAAGLGIRLKPSLGLLRIAQAGAFLAIACGLASALVHWFAGHRPGTASALSLGGFMAEHPALLAVAGLSAVALLLSRGGKSPGRG